MKDSLEISVRSVPDDRVRNAESEDDTSLSTLLHRLGQQRGSFRNFTEESLMAELSDPAIKTEQQLVETVEKDDTEETAPVDDALEHNTRSGPEVREKVLHCVGVALNEAALALDFTSLLLSATRETAAQTISPALKEAVPVASISSTRVRREKPAETASLQASLLGFQAQSLNYAVAAIRRASRQTEREQALDATFWVEVKMLLDHGWSIFRLKPGGGAAAGGIGVRYGSGSGHYIPLERDNQGHIDTTKLNDKFGSVTYTIRRNQVISARQSDAAPVSSTSDFSNDTPKIIERLKSARQSVLAFESFHGFVRECRSLATYGAIIVDRDIFIPLGSETELNISLEEVSNSSQNDTEMDVDTANTKDEYLLSTIRALIATTPSSPIHCFLNWHTQGTQLSKLTRSLESLVNGLRNYSWTSTLPHLTTTTNSSASKKKQVPKEAESTVMLEFLGTSITITIATTDPTTTRYHATVNIAPIPGLPSTTRRLTVYEVDGIEQFVHSEILECLMDYLTQDSMLMRSSKAEVRVTQLQNKRVSLDVSGAGEIKLISEDGGRKSLVKDLRTEICEEDGYL